MRVTEELRRKVSRCVTEKVQPDYDALEAEYKDRDAAAVESS